jgi:hypothetical protein
VTFIMHVFLQHERRSPCTVSVQHTLHPRGCNTGQPSYGLPNPSCTCVQDGPSFLPQFDYVVTQIGDIAVTHRPRAQKQEARCTLI